MTSELAPGCMGRQQPSDGGVPGAGAGAGGPGPGPGPSSSRGEGSDATEGGVEAEPAGGRAVQGVYLLGSDALLSLPVLAVTVGMDCFPMCQEVVCRCAGAGWCCDMILSTIDELRRRRDAMNRRGASDDELRRAFGSGMLRLFAAAFAFHAWFQLDTASTSCMVFGPMTGPQLAHALQLRDRASWCGLASRTRRSGAKLVLRVSCRFNDGTPDEVLSLEAPKDAAALLGPRCAALALPRRAELQARARADADVQLEATLASMHDLSMHDDGDSTLRDILSEVDMAVSVHNDTCAQCRGGPRAPRTKLLRCATCKQVWYCSAECQKLHWRATHKAQCGIMAGMR